MKKLTLFLILIISGYGFVQGQSNYTLSSAKNMFKGTSNLHDWQCVVEKQTGSAQINTSGKLNILSLNVTMEAKSIKSVKEDGSYFEESMDKNTYKALNAEKNPTISFAFVSAGFMNTKGNVSTFRATGDLTVNGKTNRITFPAKAVVAGNRITFSGTTKLKMTDFGVKPPTALLGTIKTGDEITVVLNTTFSK